MIVQKYRKTAKRQRSVWDDKEFVNERGTEHIKELFNGKIFTYPKSEYLISRVIELGTEPGDIVLDYHLGSGTTVSVAHKMNRQYIGIEQMDYIEKVTCQRMQKVIKGERGGISEKVNWKGGGEFVYCELKELNEFFIQKINKAKDTKELLKIWIGMKNHAFLSYRLNQNLFDENIEEFKALSSEEQKKLLLECLDVNNLYVNYSEIGDIQYDTSKEDVEINKQFYGGL